MASSTRVLRNLCLWLSFFTVGSNAVSLFTDEPEVVLLKNDKLVTKLLKETGKTCGSPGSYGVIVAFANWCGHCHHFAPHFSSAASAAKCNSRVLFYAVDGTNLVPGTATSLIVGSGFPAMAVFGEPECFSQVGNLTKLNGDSLGLNKAIYSLPLPHAASEAGTASALLQQVIDALPPGTCSTNTTTDEATMQEALQMLRSPQATRVVGRIRWSERATAVTPNIRLYDAILSLQQHVAVARYRDTKKEMKVVDKFINMVTKLMPGENLKRDLTIFLSTSGWNRTQHHEGLGWVGIGGDYLGADSASGGVWDLFHFLSLRLRETKAVTPVEFLEAVGSFVAKLFECTDCRTNFAASYAGCLGGRCDWVPESKTENHTRLEPIKLAKGTRGDGFRQGYNDTDSAVTDSYTGIVMFLWRFHNMVTKRTAIERTVADMLAGGELDAFSNSDVAFPTKEQCPKCRHEFVDWSNYEYGNPTLVSPKILEMYLLKNPGSQQIEMPEMDSYEAYDLGETLKFLEGFYALPDDRMQNTVDIWWRPFMHKWKVAEVRNVPQ